MGNYVSLDQEQFAGSTLVAPNPFYGHTGQLALDLWLNDPTQCFRKVGWLLSPHLAPRTGPAPLDWMAASDLAHPAELYCNGHYTVLQIRSSVSSEDVRQLLKDLWAWTQPRAFSAVVVLSTNLVLTRAVPEGEKAFCVKSRNCSLQLGVPEYEPDERLRELLRAEDMPSSLLDTPPLPFLLLFSSSLRLFDFEGARDLLEVLSNCWQFPLPNVWPQACEPLRTS